MVDNKDAQPSNLTSATTSVPAAPAQRKELGAAVLTVLFSLLLIDAAVETFLSGAPVRWWVAGVTSTYLAVVLLFWRSSVRLRDRISWPARRNASFVTLVGLFALTAYLPGGLTEGVRILGQPTSTVLALISGLAVAGAGLAIIRAGLLPWWGAVAVGLFAIYGIASFIFGITESTSYPGLFQGESFWRRVPFWLQGAFIGTLVLIPLAVVLDAISQLRKQRAAEKQPWRWQQTVALTMVVCIAFSSVAGTEIRARSSPSAAAAAHLSAEEAVQPLQPSSEKLGKVLMPASASNRPLEDLADRLDALWPTVEATEREMTRLTFDPKAVVTQAGREPSKLFYWVRDETSLVAYRGILRGEVGVLMDRLGNSLDRAMLLYGLLRDAGHTARLAHGTLSEAQATYVQNNARPSRTIEPLLPPAEGLKAKQDLLEAEMTKQGIDPVMLREGIREVASEEVRISENAARRAESQARVIAAAIRNRPPAERLSEKSERMNDLRDHWWVQVSNATGWVDLDPTLPDSEPGRTLLQPHETVRPDAQGRLPPEYHHTVGIRVLIEQWEDGRLEERQVLQHVFRPSEHFGMRIALSHHPMQWPATSDMFGGTAAQPQLERAVLTQEEWVPVLRLGPETIIQSSFTRDGEINQTPLAPLLGGSAQKLGRGLGDILGGGKIGGSGRSASRSEGQLTAEWIDFEIHSPGRQNRIIRREIFDLLGPARRLQVPATLPSFAESEALDRGFSLLGETEILPLVCRLPLEFVQHLTSTSLIANRQGLSTLLRRAADLDRKSIVSQASELTPAPSKLYGLALARLGWSRFRADLYIDQPNILGLHKRLRKNSTGNMALLEGFDIVANDVAIHPSAHTDPFLVKLEQGVLDTNVEAFLATGCQGAQNIRPECPPVHNVAESFAATADPAREWLTIQSLDDKAWERVVAPPDARIRIEQDLKAGNIVMVRRDSKPDQPFAGWWSIDPGTGRTLGIGERGWGQTATEIVVMYVSLTIGLVVGIFAAFGCGSMAPGVSDAKFALCLVCALVAGVLAVFMFSELLIVGVVTTTMGSGVFSTGIGVICSAIAGGMS